jgi:hypothetical protein
LLVTLMTPLAPTAIIGKVSASSPLARLTLADARLNSSCE